MDKHTIHIVDREPRHQNRYSQSHTLEFSMDRETVPIKLPFRRILVCSDLSSDVTRFVDVGINLCRMTEAKLFVLNVVEDGRSVSSGAKQNRESGLSRHDREEKLEEVLSGAEKQGVRGEAIIRDGTAAEAILEAMDEYGIDLAVLGTRGLSGIGKPVFGSTAEVVLGKTRCPVVTVGTQVPSSKIKHGNDGPVIFATDFHRTTTDAIRYGASLANEINVALHCIHVLPLLRSKGEAQIVSQIMLDALRHLVEGETIDARSVGFAVTQGSEVSQAIVEYARTHQAQFIVLGARRASFLASQLPAQVVYRIILTAPCPVLTVSFDCAVMPSLSVACF